MPQFRAEQVREDGIPDCGRALQLIEDVDVSIAVVVNAGKKDPFFDRHEYWTKEHWDETFNKEFPTFNRGFIGAVEE